jgi:hypothetical protein
MVIWYVWARQKGGSDEMRVIKLLRRNWWKLGVLKPKRAVETNFDSGE